MQRVLLVLIAIAALGLAGWFGVHALGGKHPLASIQIPLRSPENLPDTPAEWRGRIDYRALDRQLSDLSQRPEMAGLAVAVEWGRAWRFIVNGSVEILANELRESPLVERGWVNHAFVAVNYTF